MEDNISNYQGLAFKPSYHIQEIAAYEEDSQDPLLPPRKVYTDGFEFQTKPNTYPHALDALIGSMRQLTSYELLKSKLRMSDTYYEQILSLCLDQNAPTVPPHPHIFREDLFEAIGESYEGRRVYMSIHGCIVSARPKQAQNTLMRGQLNIHIEELKRQQEEPSKRDLEKSVEDFRLKLFIPLQFTKLK